MERRQYVIVYFIAELKQSDAVNITINQCHDCCFLSVSSFMDLNRNICSLRSTASNVIQLVLIVRTTKSSDFSLRCLLGTKYRAGHSE